MDIVKHVTSAMKNYPLYSQEIVATEKKMVRAKLFSLYSWATWYLVEFDVDTGMAFGYVEWLTDEPDNDEWGYFNINELQSLMNFGIPMVELDKFFQSKPFGQIKIRGR